MFSVVYVFPRLYFKRFVVLFTRFNQLKLLLNGRHALYNVVIVVITAAALGSRRRAEDFCHTARYIFTKYSTVRMIIPVAFVVQLTSAILWWVFIIVDHAVCASRDVSWLLFISLTPLSHHSLNAVGLLLSKLSDTNSHIAHFIQHGWCFCP